jgi:hypothetical protein
MKMKKFGTHHVQCGKIGATDCLVVSSSMVVATLMFAVCLRSLDVSFAYGGPFFLHFLADASSDEWIRIAIEAGDLVVLP